MKKRLSRKHIVLIVLCAVLLITLIAGGATLYAKYMGTTSAGNLSVRVDPPSQSGLTVKDYNENDGITFNEIPSVYPFG